MTPDMSPYTPSQYQPDSYARFRQYPHNVVTPIPGAGYDVGELMWAEQELNLDGASGPQQYGNYRQVPLRGLGIDFSKIQLPLRPMTLQLPTSTPPPETPTAPSPNIPAYDVAAAIQQAAEEARAAQSAPMEMPAEGGFFAQKVGPVPVWALGLGGLAVLGGGTWLLLRRRRRVTSNRRRAR